MNGKFEYLKENLSRHESEISDIHDKLIELEKKQDRIIVSMESILSSINEIKKEIKDYDSKTNKIIEELIPIKINYENRKKIISWIAENYFRIPALIVVTMVFTNYIFSNFIKDFF